MDSRLECDEHCDEHHHDATQQYRDHAFRDSVHELLYAYHRTHDQQFSAAVCTDAICRRLGDELR